MLYRQKCRGFIVVVFVSVWRERNRLIILGSSRY